MAHLSVEQLIGIYRQLRPDPEGESFAKLETIDQLAALAGPKVLDFIIATARNSQEPWLARVQALKALRLWKCDSEDEYRRIAETAAGLMDDPDRNIRNYAVAAVRWQYHDHGSIFAKLLKIVLDHNESPNTRYSALSAIFEAGPRQDSRRALKKLSGQRHELAAEATRILDDWEKSEDDDEE